MEGRGCQGELLKERSTPSPWITAPPPPPPLERSSCSNARSLEKANCSLKTSPSVDPHHVQDQSFPVVKNVIKGQWAPEEDSLLNQLVAQFGAKKWSEMSKMFGGRNGKQCRERWHNHLRPGIKKDKIWTAEEEMIFIESHRQFGNRWVEISKRIPGRSENCIKNHWNSKKRQIDYARQNGRRRRSLHSNPEAQPSILEEYIRSMTFNPTAFAPSGITPPLPFPGGGYHQIDLAPPPSSMIDAIFYVNNFAGF